MARDRMLALVRRELREARRKGQYGAGVAASAAHRAADAVSGGDGAQPDDVTLARKVESEIARAAPAAKGAVAVNAEDGVVYLRGELQDEGEINALVEAAARVTGVEGVESLLHTTGTPAPMKR